MAEDYLANLDRAISKMPEKSVSDERFTIPEAHVIPEGKTTVLDNITNIADALNRELNHLLKFLVREMGTAAKMDGSRAILQGRFTSRQISAQIESYVDQYVMCSECNRPDTEFVKSERVMMLKCHACGATRPVKKRKM